MNTFKNDDTNLPRKGQKNIEQRQERVKMKKDKVRVKF